MSKKVAVGVMSAVRIEERWAKVLNEKGKETMIPYQEPYLDFRIVWTDDNGNPTETIMDGTAYVVKHPVVRYGIRIGEERMDMAGLFKVFVNKGLTFHVRKALEAEIISALSARLEHCRANKEKREQEKAEAAKRAA